MSPLKRIIIDLYFLTGNSDVYEAPNPLKFWDLKGSQDFNGSLKGSSECYSIFPNYFQQLRR